MKEKKKTLAEEIAEDLARATQERTKEIFGQNTSQPETVATVKAEPATAGK